jgi:predicted lysophospholipase L1 biosynthesis ABC-type transport system permease subunit
VRDAALLKVLGAGRLTLGISLLVEFAALGSVASFGGLALSIGVGWGLVHGVFETDLVIPWAYLAGLAVLATVLCSITGVLACWRVFAVKPLEVLREEGQV